MKYLRLFSLIIILIMVVNILKAQEFTPGFFDLKFHGRIGSLISGKQREVGEEALEPKPTAFTTVNIDVTAEVFPLTFFGIPFIGVEGGYSLLGLVQASHKEVKDPMDMYDYSFIHAGGVIRIPFRLETYMTELDYSSVFAGGGITYSFIEYADEFKDFVTDALEEEGYIVTFYDTVPRIGWFAKGGYNYYLLRYIVFSIGAQVFFMDAEFEISNENINGLYLQGFIGLGFSL